MAPNPTHLDFASELCESITCAARLLGLMDQVKPRLFTSNFKEASGIRSQGISQRSRTCATSTRWRHLGHTYMYTSGLEFEDIHVDHEADQSLWAPAILELWLR